MFKNFLVSLLGLNIYVYGLGVAITLILFLFFFWRAIRKTSFNEEKLVDALFSSGLVALIFGRGAYVFFNPDIFKGSVLKPFILLTYPGVDEFFFWLAFLAFWLVYGSRKKHAFSALFKLIVGPIILAKIMLGFFSLIKAFSLVSLGYFCGLLLLVGLYYFLSRVIKKEKIFEVSYAQLALYLALPLFVVDFFKPERVYFLGQKVLSLAQLPWATVFVLIVITGIITRIKKKK